MTARVPLHKLSVDPHLLAEDVDDQLQKGRVIIEGEGNPTSSLKDEALAEFRTPALTAEQTQSLENWDFRLEKTRPLIEQHVEKRVSQLFVQAVLCYQTNYQFREGRTIHQGRKAETLKYDKGEKKLSFQAAHSPTVPSLYAYSEDTQQEIVFLYRSSFYDESNATIDMLKEVNDADRAIDEKYADSLLRKKVIKLLNKAAKGELTPEQVAKEFSMALLREIKKSIRREKNPYVRDVLELYRDRAELLWSYVDEPTHVDRWLNLNMGDPLLDPLTKALLDNEPLTRDQILSLIEKKIDALPPVIVQELHQKRNQSRAPFHFYELYYDNILRRLDARALPVAEEALGIQFAALRDKVAGFQRVGTTRALLAEHEAQIDAVAQEILSLAPHFQGQPVLPDQIEGVSKGKVASLRPGIYQLRYRMIRADQEAQSVVKSKIEDVLHRLKNGTTATSYLEAFFYQSLFKYAVTKTEEKMFSKLLNISPLQLRQKIREIKVNSQAHATLDKYSSQISKISKKVHKARKEPSQEKSAELQRRIEKVYDQMKSEKNNKSLDILFYKRLFDHAYKKADKRLLTALLSKTEEQLDRSIQALSKCNSAEAHVEANSRLIRQVQQVASKQIFDLRVKTMDFQSELMVELRLSHGMSQNHFKKFYKEHYPEFPMSDGTMSDLENKKKTITPDIVDQLAEIFGVSSTLFYPSHFADAP